VRVKMILPALTEAISPYYRPIKYSLFPPLGLATLAAYLAPDDDVAIQDEHVEPLDQGDEPDLVVIQATSALPMLESVLDRFGRHPAGLVEPREAAITAGSDHPRLPGLLRSANESRSGLNIGPIPL